MTAPPPGPVPVSPQARRSADRLVARLGEVAPGGRVLVVADVVAVDRFARAWAEAFAGGPWSHRVVVASRFDPLPGEGEIADLAAAAIHPQARAVVVVGGPPAVGFARRVGRATGLPVALWSMEDGDGALVETAADAPSPSALAGGAGGQQVRPGG